VTNPYQAPRATVDLPTHERPFLWVVLGAFLVGTGLAFVLQTVSGVALSWVLVGSGVRTEDLYSAMAESPGINLWAHLTNVIAVMPAGALVAWLRPTSPIGTGTWVGALMVAFVILQFTVPYEHQAPLWSKILALVTPIPSVIAGAWLWVRRAA
jgi:hypothetical protein